MLFGALVSEEAGAKVVGLTGAVVVSGALVVGLTVSVVIGQKVV